MEKYAIWERFNGDKVLIPEEDIKENVYLDDQNIKIELTSKDLVSKGLDEDKITEALSSYREENQIEGRIGIDELGEFLEEQGFDPLPSFIDGEAFVSPEDTIIFNAFDDSFDNLKNYETIRVYEHLDSNMNWETIFNNNMETIVEIEEKQGQSLDIWDGNNMCTDRPANHQKFYPVIAVDNEMVEEETYLLKEWDQFQGTFETAEIMDKEELIDHIKRLGDRDLEDYGLEESDVEKEKRFVGGYYDDRIFKDERFEGKTPFNKEVDTYSLKQIEANEAGFIQDVAELFSEELEDFWDERSNSYRSLSWEELSFHQKTELILGYTETDDIAGLEYFNTKEEAEKYKEEILEEIKELENEVEYVGKEQDREGYYREVYKYKDPGEKLDDKDTKVRMAHMRNQLER